MRWSSACAVACALAMIGPPAGAQGLNSGSVNIQPLLAAAEEASDQPAEDVFDSESLMFADVPIVISASRRPQSALRTSIPTSIVTAEDIHYSGATTVPEMLMFVPGLDILPSDRNIVAVGVHGLHHQLSDRTLVLIDGRDATNPVFGGTDFYRLPVFPEDIERIEVVRGPAGAAWGANAFNGVINIISKSPKDTQGLFASSTINEFGDTFSHLRWGSSRDDWSWRMSLGYEEHETSEDAVAGDDFESRDFGRDIRFDTVVEKEGLGGDVLKLGGSYMHIERGDFEFVGFPLEMLGDERGEDRMDIARMFARMETDAIDGGSGYLQWLGRYEDVNRYALWRYQVFENDIEGQWNFSPWGNHEVTIGGNVRWVHIETERVRETDLLPTETYDEFWAGLFIIDEWDLADRWTLESQLRGDYYSETHPDWSGRVTLLYDLDDAGRHVLRGSVAKAFRAPYTFLRELQGSRLELFGMPLLNFVQAEDIQNEQVYSAEAGYSGQLTDELTIKVNGYYHRYEDLIGARTQLVGPTSFSQVDNIAGGSAWGAETELAYHLHNLKLSAWYAYNAFQADQPDQTIRAFQPARHKAGVSGRLFLPCEFVFNVNYKFVNTTLNDPVTDGEPDVESFHRLDLTLSKGIGNGRGEIMIGVQDVLDDTNLEILSLGSFQGHEMPGRTFFLRVQARF